MPCEKTLHIEQYLKTERILRDFYDRHTVPICVGYCVENEDEHDCCINQTARIAELGVRLIGLDLLALRAAKYPQTTGRGCGYLTAYGCILKEYRSPVCNTFVCQVLVKCLDLIGPGLGHDLDEVQRLSNAIFKTLPEPVAQEIRELQRRVDELSRSLDAIVPPGLDAWTYVVGRWGRASVCP